jgi:hypothetical protein
MSSTNRGGQREASDYYFTPLDSIELVLSWLQKKENLKFAEMMICDPCAGGDAAELPRYPLALSKIGVSNVVTFDIREDSRAEFKQDYLKTEIREGYFDLIISNPPFSHAEQFIRKAYKELKVGGWCVFLLRLNYYGTRERGSLWEFWMPKYTICQAAPRMKFSNAPGTDSVEYAHFAFQKGVNPAFSELHLVYLPSKR